MALGDTQCQPVLFPLMRAGLESGTGARVGPLTLRRKSWPAQVDPPTFEALAPRDYPVQGKLILFPLLRASPDGRTIPGGAAPLRPWLKAWLPQVDPLQFEALSARDYPGLRPTILFPLHPGRRISFSRSLPLPAPYLRIFGVTKDSAGAALGNCTVKLFRSTDDVEMDQTVSDGSGNYEMRSASLSTAYYIVAYKAGAPDVAGTTVNTLVGV